MRAFDIHAPLPAAAVVLLLMNVATVFPLWPGNVGLTQIAIATPLTASYGVAYAHGVAYGFGLQAIEASVGIGVGLLFLAREGLSFAMLQVMPSADQAEMREQEADAQEERGCRDRARSRARLASKAFSPRAPRRRRSQTASRRRASSACSCRSQTAARERSTRSARGGTARPSSRRRRRFRSIPRDSTSWLLRAVAFGELLAGLDAERLLVGLGGTANMDAGAGLLEVLAALPAPTTVLCDVQTTLYDAPRLFGPQKGATPEQVAELERRFRSIVELAPFAELPGSGAAGGLGAALASLGAELVPGAAAILDLLGFEPSAFDLVVTGEGRVDATTGEGKAPAEVARRCAAAGVPCVVFGGVVTRAARGCRDGRALRRSGARARRISSS